MRLSLYERHITSNIDSHVSSVLYCRVLSTEYFTLTSKVFIDSYDGTYESLLITTYTKGENINEHDNRRELVHEDAHGRETRGVGCER